MRRRVVSKPKFTAGRIFIDDWSAPNPRKLIDSTNLAHGALYGDCGTVGADITLDYETVRALKEAAEAYLHLTTHPAGTGRALGQLRDIRAALKAKAKAKKARGR